MTMQSVMPPKPHRMRLAVGTCRSGAGEPASAGAAGALMTSLFVGIGGFTFPCRIMG